MYRHCKECGLILSLTNKNGYCFKHRNLSEKRKSDVREAQKRYEEKKKQTKKIKYCKECGKTLRVSNTIGYCREHRILSPKRGEQINEYVKSRYKRDVQFRLRMLISASIRGKIRKEKSTNNYANLDKIKDRLESLFTEEMNWENHGTYWHIDHIIPQSLFDFTKDEHIKMCWSEKNLRPILKKENILKSNSVDYVLINKNELRDVLEEINHER